jgi:serine/threonine protein phosphatase 1
LKRPQSPNASQVAATPDDRILFAVGDVHGRDDLLATLIDAIGREAGDGKPTTAIFLGDYIDRGPSARQVIDRLIGLAEETRFETVFLRGNHEQFLLDLIDGREDGATWLEYGGVETLASYGARVGAADAADPARLAAVVRAAVPESHVDFLRRAELSYACGDYVFVHAGMRPDKLLEEQSDTDLLWFRYYDDETPVHGRVVVHGHTPRARPVNGRWRIGVDTEAWASGALTAVRLEDGSRRFLKTEGAEVVEWDKADAPHERPQVSAKRDAKQRRAHSNQVERRAWIVVGAVSAALALCALSGLAWRASAPPQPAAASAGR